MRVIAGSARGIPLKAPVGMDTRPTVDKVKEAVFGSLQFFLPGSRVLDLFAGSGALGIEALSRGAAAAVLVEKQAAAMAVIRPRDFIIRRYGPSGSGNFWRPGAGLLPSMTEAWRFRKGFPRPGAKNMAKPIFPI